MFLCGDHAFLSIMYSLSGASDEYLSTTLSYDLNTLNHLGKQNCLWYEISSN